MLDELQLIWDAVDRGGDQIGEDLWKNSQPPRPDTLININVAITDPTSQHIQYAYAERPNNSNPGTNITVGGGLPGLRGFFSGFYRALLTHYTLSGERVHHTHKHYSPTRG